MSRFPFHSVPTKALGAICLGALLYSCSPSSPAEVEPSKVAATTETPAVNAPAANPEPEKPKEPEVPKFEKPDKVRGIYVTAWTAGGQTRMEQLLDLLDRTELNAMVIDIRDSGNMYFKTDIELAKHAPATQVAIKDGKPLMKKLKERGVYPIARVACFRDKYVPKAVPELGVQVASGKPWADRSGHTWLDPYNKKNWEYIAETVEFALDLGFPEIQLDYVRFPSEGNATTQVFPAKKDYPNKDAKPDDVITEFAEYIGEKVRARGAVYSADIFGIISSGTTDQGIGQTLEKIAEPFDLVCPMVYPSHFAKGEYGIAHPNASPYATIIKSLNDYKRRIPNKAVRPWLQDFSLFGVKYGPEQVKAQIKAAREVGYTEYLLWNASNRYTEAGVAKAETDKKDSEPTEGAEDAKKPAPKKP